MKLTESDRAKVIIPGYENAMNLMGFDPDCYHRIPQSFIDHFTLTAGDIEDSINRMIESGEAIDTGISIITNPDYTKH